MQPESIGSRTIEYAGLVVVTSAADGVSRPSDHHEYQADDEKDDADDHQDVSEGEGWYQAREDQPEDDEDDSENNHDVDPLSSGVLRGSAVPVPGMRISV